MIAITDLQTALLDLLYELHGTEVNSVGKIGLVWQEIATKNSSLSVACSV